jgi:hypothetical protein
VFSADLLNLFVPTTITRIGRQTFAEVQVRFTGNAAENGAYLGAPLLIIVLAYGILHWGTRLGRFLVLASALLTVAALGPKLHIGGILTMTLPWQAVVRLPFVEHALPVRFTVYVALATAVIAAVYVGGAGGWRSWRWALGLAAALFLVPNTAIPYWHTTLVTPAYFSQHLYRQGLPPHPNLLVIPFMNMGVSTAWQAEADMDFRLAGAYVTPETPSEFAFDPILGVLNSPAPTLQASSSADLAAYVKEHRVDAIVVQDGTPGPWTQLIKGLGVRPEHVGGVTLYRLAAAG